MTFSEKIIEDAKSIKKTIILPEGDDRRVVQGGCRAQREGIAQIKMVGTKEQAAELADGASLDGIEFISPESCPKTEEYANQLYELRKSKGMTPDKAKETVKDPLYFANMMLKLGDGDGIVAGAAHSTGDVLRPALQIVKPLPGVKTVSSCFIMVHPDPKFGDKGVYVYGDCAMVINPTAQQLAEIAITSANTARNLCKINPPVIAMLSFSTKGSATDPLVDKVVEATRIAKQMAPNLIIDGELQLDAAIIPGINESKAPGSPVKGMANVLIFPDLNAGNIGYKLTQRLGGAEAIGPVIQGLAKPVSDLSRGCSADDVLKTIAITSVQSRSSK